MEPTRERAYQRRIAELEAENADLKALVAELKSQVARLAEQVAKLSKNSSNSSKPPSSDIVKAPNRNSSNTANSRKKKRKIGGQPGHPKHEREPFTPEEIDDTHKYELNCCPDCGGAVGARPKAARVVQQVELIDKPVEIVEHCAEGRWCRRCQKAVYASLPATVQRAGLVGPKLTALVGFMRGVCHASFSTIRKYFRDVLKIRISRGQLVKVLQKVSAALKPAYQELWASLPSEPRLNVDETGHKNNGKRYWTWCFRAELYTLFKIDHSRSSSVLIDALGEEFNGVLGCDYFSAYRKYMREFGVELQFCLAHLIRDVKFIIGLPGRRVQAYGERLLDAIRKMFSIIHRRDTLTPKGFERTLKNARADVINAATWAPQKCKQALNLAERFRKHGEAYFRFITTPGVEPTNNLAEQAIRFVVIDRKITQGTRSETGQRCSERMWTVVATCRQQGRSVFKYLREAVNAHFHGQPIPSLLPAGP